jgi:hypothetical protein
MATQERTIDFLLEQATSAGLVAAKPMFGEYGVYVDGKMIGLRQSALRQANGIGPRPCRTGVRRTAASRCQTADAHRGRSIG